MPISKKSKTNQPSFFTAFTTAWGPAGVVGGAEGISQVVLPHYQMNDLIDLLKWNHPSAQRDDGHFEAFIAACRDFFNGKPADFASVQCQLPQPDSFAGKVYRTCQTIPPGQTLSYRELALAIGNPDAARAVATTMSKNKIPLLVPCHRVIYSSGQPGGFNAEGGSSLKLRLISHEKNFRGLD